MYGIMSLSHMGIVTCFLSRPWSNRRAERPLTALALIIDDLGEYKYDSK